MSESAATGGSFAIVGMAGRFPGARDVAAFWENLREGRESISFFTDEELRSHGVDARLLPDPAYVRAKGYLEDAELFDADYFGLSARQAEILDPQQRIFLETAVEALEHAGCDPRRFPGAIGVFAGASMNTYLLRNLSTRPDLIELVGSLAFTSNRTDHLATRVAYSLDLRGPAITVQTACSTSLVASHLACSALAQGECDVALAGGVTITLPRKTGYRYHEGGVLSPDGHCRAFDARAQGTVIGEGAALVVLKRLEDALAGGDTIYAIVRGSALNNDGSLKVGYTAPSVDGQMAVIAEAQAVAGIHPDTLTYIETHGTGTPLGDPIEVAALARVFRNATTEARHCAIGSVKTNIGHLDAAAGVAGLIKVALALHHRELPPTLHYESANPEIDFASTPFYVNTKRRSWDLPAYGGPRRAGVSSFGFGGTNCHMVLEEAPPARRSSASRPDQLIMLSAKSLPALESATERLVAELRSRPSTDLADVAYTLATGRTEHTHRRAVACSSVDECVQFLTQLKPTRVFTGEARLSGHGAVFLFPGQGSQHTGMGQQLYQEEETFRRSMDQCFEIIGAELGEDPKALFWDPARSAQLQSTQWAQVALFSVEWSLSELWRNWGVEPAAMIGHSVGEYVAACLAGVFSFEDAFRLILYRGRLMQARPRGSMLSASIAERDMERWLARLDPQGERLALAAVNGSALCVASGVSEAIDELERELTRTGAQCRRLHVSHAFHSPMMQPVLADFGARIARIARRPPSLRWVSNLTGDWIRDEEATDPAYWMNHLRRTVRFGDGLSLVLSQSREPLLEVGPGQALRSLARWHPNKAAGRVVLSSLPRADGDSQEGVHLRNTLARLWVAGVQVDQTAYYSGERRRRIALPTYSFDRKRYWVEPATAGVSAAAGHRRFDEWFYVPAWRRTVLPQVVHDAPREGRRWLIVADEMGFAERLAECIRRRGERVEIHPPGSYSTLLQSLQARSALPQRIVHLAGLADVQSAECTTEGALQRGFYDLLHLARAMGEVSFGNPCRLLVVANGQWDINGNEPLCPAQAATLGVCRVLPQENPAIECCNLDVVVPGPDAASWEKLADQIVNEGMASGVDRAVAYRGNQRWVEAYDRISLSEIAEGQTLVRRGGVYLITGGLGGIGLEIAELLAAAGGTRIALIGRTALSADDERVERVKQLEKKAELLLLTADVADADRMTGVVQQVRERFGEIHGVVHAAGIAGGGVIQLKKDSDAASVLAPKLRGVEVLASIFAERSLDFLVLCSARGALLGRMGQVDYCAANACLDAFAHWLARKSDTRVVAIDWPAWKDVGMLRDQVEARQDKLRAPRIDGTAMSHPLFDQRVWLDEHRAEYYTRFEPARHWVLDEHRIVRSPVVPGTAYLEMARAAIEDHCGAQPIELREVFFFRPLVVRDGQFRFVRGRIECSGCDVRFRFSAASPGEESDSTAWIDICEGLARLQEPSAVPVHDLGSWLAQCRRGDPTLREDMIGDDNGPRWRSLRRLHLGDRELVVRLELPSEFAYDIPTLGLHPALLDRVNLAGREFLAGELASRNFYLPFSYRSIMIHSTLPRAFWAHCRLRALHENDRAETITFDTVLVDDEGRELVRIEEFTQKRVSDAVGQIKALGGDERAPTHVSADSAADRDVYERALRAGISSEEGRLAFSRILAARGLPQIVVSPVELSEAIAESRRSASTPAAVEARPATSAAYVRPTLPTEYRAPSGELEQTMATIWQDMLGVQPVGVDDNFFELGGDSVQAIQLIARHRERGIPITQQQLFQNQTIAALAAAIGGGSDAERGGSRVPLAPLQHRMLLEGARRAGAICARFKLPGVELQTLTDALDAVRRAHLALAMRFRLEDGRWRQELQLPPPPVRVVVASLPDDEDRAERELAELRSALAANLDPLVGVTLLPALLTRADGSTELLLLVHELVADAQSMGILLEDITHACAEAAAGRPMQIARQGSSFPEWCAQIEAGVSSGATQELKADSTRTTCSRVLSAGQTAGLFDLCARQRVSIEELVLFCLQRIAAGPIELQHSIRAGHTGRTVGPLQRSRLLDLGRLRDDANAWRFIKSQLRPLLTEDVTPLHEQAPSLRVVWGGNVASGAVVELSWMPLSAEAPSCPVLRVFQRGKSLSMHWDIAESDALAWSDRLCDELSSIVAAGRNVREVELHTSDFPLANLDEKSLRRVAEMLNQLDDAGS